MLVTSRLLNRPCTITRRGDSDALDEYNDPIPAVPVEIETVCELQQQQRTEPVDQGESSDTRWALFLPAGTDITTGDSITVDGLAYEMVGDPWHARDPITKRESHLEANVRRTA
jgi:hypothetical protein